MTDQQIIRRICRGDPQALEEAIHTYSAYVCTVLRNRSRGLLPEQDIEEAASDIFAALWTQAGSIASERLQSWLGALARNKAVDYLRKQTPLLPLDEASISCEDGLWQALRDHERIALVQDALAQFKREDREIFLRYYDLCQTTGEIAQQMNLSQGAVKSRLFRGRKQLKEYFEERGLDREALL